MKNKILIVLGVVVLFFGLTFSQENKNWKDWYKSFLRTLKYKIDKKISPNTKITAVAAVRGSKVKNKSKELYWKGTNSQKAQEKIENDKKIMQESIEKILNGNINEGKIDLQNFIKNNPNSYFIKEAKEALEKLPKSEIEEVSKSTQTITKTDIQEDNSDKEELKSNDEKTKIK